MGKLLIAVVALVVGAIGGAFFGSSLLGGAMMGAGVGTGLSAGICSTVKAAQEEGLLTAAQVDQVMSRAAKDLAAWSGEAEPGPVAGSAAACDDALARLKAAASS